MKRLLISLAVLAIGAALNPVSAQDGIAGIITYEQVVDYGIEPRGNPRWDNFIADLPKKGKAFHTLTFNEKFATYEEDLDKKEAMDPMLEKVLARVNYRKPPQEKWKLVFYDFENNQRTEVFEFMTRTFIMDQPIAKSAWKMGGERKQVGDFVCLGAKLEGEENIVAWFSPELPLPAGPGVYSGLPGIILAIEVDEQIVLMATTIDLEPSELQFEAPKEGKKVTEEEFAIIKEEKTAEHMESLPQRGAGRGAGQGPPQGGRKAN